MAIASFLILTFTLIYDNYVRYGEFIDYQTFRQIFHGHDQVFLAWWTLVIHHFTIIPITKVGIDISLILGIILYLIHLAFITWFSLNLIPLANLGFAARMIILAEGTRMMMKSHSYFRTKMLYCTNNNYKNYSIKGVSVNGNDEKHSIKVNIDMKDFFGELKRLVFFLFSPTLIYRD